MESLGNLTKRSSQCSFKSSYWSDTNINCTKRNLFWVHFLKCFVLWTGTLKKKKKVPWLHAKIDCLRKSTSVIVEAANMKKKKQWQARVLQFFILVKHILCRKWMKWACHCRRNSWKNLWLIIKFLNVQKIKQNFAQPYHHQKFDNIHS